MLILSKKSHSIVKSVEQVKVYVLNYTCFVFL